MELKPNTVQMKLAYEMFQGIQEDNFEYIYRGFFTQSITENILSLAEINLNDEDDAVKIKKRIYFIMVECLQNITRHQDPALRNSGESGIFVIQKKKHRYLITTGNLISVNKIPTLKQQLNMINSLDKDELKDYYKEMLLNGSLSDKGGAGLGLIEMARKSGNKLSFDFKTFDDVFSYFYLTTEIPVAQNFVPEENLNYSIRNIIEYHETLNKEDILLNFKGAFNQDNLLGLLNIIEQHMKESVFSIKAFNIMVEMLQNIVKHADNINNNLNGRFGIFLLSENENQYLLTAGNYIHNSKIPALRNKLIFVNSLSHEELDSFYDDTLLNLEIDDNLRSGLGIIDMRLKSEEKYNFDFKPVNENYSFYTLQTGVKKNRRQLLPLFIEATKDSPEIILNPINNIFTIKGRSIAEDALTFYQPILDWIELYSEAPAIKTNFSFQIDYFNTSSAKQIVKIMLLLEKTALKSEVVISWHYKKVDVDMLSAGLRYQKLINVKFNLIEI